VNFDTDMVGDQTHDPLGIGWRYAAARILKAAR
jgi:hypothetical protein